VNEAIDIFVERTFNLVNKKEMIIFKERKELKRWKEYIGELFEDFRPDTGYRNKKRKNKIINNNKSNRTRYKCSQIKENCWL